MTSSSSLNLKGLMRSLTGWLGKPLATPETDPQRFFGSMLALPNPDPILREMGQAEKVYYSIASDPHVLGDIRSIRGNFRSHQYRINSGDEGNAKSEAAQQLCQQWMERCQPNHLADWLEVMWQMSASFMTGYTPHELVWSLQDGKYLPQQVIDRPGRRFKFNSHGEPLLVSIDAPMGKPLPDPYLFAISRHMPTAVNPYGVAVLSSCFWSWTFKTGGWRYFVKYCERHGLPWPIARYPMGTGDKEIDQLEAAVADMVEAGYVVTQEGNGLELLVPSGSGSAHGLPQQQLIDACNREISKALTGQAMVSELQGTGARAASETALKRQESIDDSVRDISAQTMGGIFRWITLFNFGDGVAPPTLEFYKHENAGKDRAETYEVANRLGAKPSKRAMLEELGIPEAEGPEDELRPAAATPPGGAGGAGGLPGNRPGKQPPTTQAGTNPNPDQAGGGTGGTTLQMALRQRGGFSFALAAGMTDAEAEAMAAEAADQAIADQMIAPIAQMLAQFEADGKTLQDFSAALQQMVGAMDDAALREVIDAALKYSLLRGAATLAG